MPWKLVGFIICLILGTCFAGFNLENSCNISFGFKTFQNVPIFFSLIVAFAIGVIVTLPFTVIKKKSAKDRKALIEARARKKIQKEQEREAKAAKKEARSLAQQEKAANKDQERQRKAEEKKQQQGLKEGGVISMVDSSSPGSLATGNPSSIFKG